MRHGVWRSGIYAGLYATLVVTRFHRGLSRHAADSISRASLEVANLVSILLSIWTELATEGRGYDRYTFGRRRLHVLASLVVCVVVAVDCLLNCGEVLDDLSWLPDKESLWEKKEVNALQMAVGVVGMALISPRAPSRIRVAGDYNRCGLYTHAMATFLDASVALFVSLAANEHQASLVMNFIGTAGAALVVFAMAMPLVRRVLRTLLHGTPPELDAALTKRIRQLASVPGIRDCTNVHFWSESPGVHVCTMTLLVSRDADGQAVHAAVFELFDDLLDDLTVELVRDAL